MLSFYESMNHRTRYVLALTLVATTLCAGHLFASDQKSPTETRVTENLVARLTRSFSHVVCRTPIVVQQRIASPVTHPLLVISTECDHCITLLNFQLNLPPPLV